MLSRRHDTAGADPGRSAPAGAERCEAVAGEGWHPDPYDLGGERWWDGTKWTDHVRGAPGSGGDPVTASERLRGMPPGWYAWRGGVARWWNGRDWGSARRPFADHVTPHESATRKRRALVRIGSASVLALLVTGVVLGITLTGGPTPSGYRTTVGLLCRQTFARERADILEQSTAAVSARGPHLQAMSLARLLRALVYDRAVFDDKLEAIAPPANLRPTEEQYLSLEREDSSIYGRVIPRLEGRPGLRALNAVTELLGRNAAELQMLRTHLGGEPCSTSPFD